jgi:hypothetical protein
MKSEDELGPLTQARIGTYQHFRWLKGIILTTLVLNTLDAFLTMYVVYSGRATEANPLMEPLVDQSPVMFFLVKTALVVLGCWLLWRFRKRHLAVIAMFFAFLVYYCILIYHLTSLRLRLLDHVF